MFRKWVSVESPYVLQDQELRSYVFMKAIDKAGNKRIVSLPPKYPLKWYEMYENWIIIIIIAVFAIYLIFKFQLKLKMKNEK